MARTPGEENRRLQERVTMALTVMTVGYAGFRVFAFEHPLVYGTIAACAYWLITRAD